MFLCADDEDDDSTQWQRLAKMASTHGVDPAAAAAAAAHAGAGGDRPGDVSLTFEQCSVFLRKHGAERALLRGVAGAARGGGVLAIMGPSGAGKTTLVRLLTLEPTGRSVRAEGDVRLDGRALTAATYRRRCALVAQNSRHWACLTCEEHVAFAVALYQVRARARTLALSAERSLSPRNVRSLRGTFAL